jgi:hypothetical protein
MIRMAGAETIIFIFFQKGVSYAADVLDELV